VGLIRKSLFVATGVVAPNSKKQRTALKTLAAVQGKSAAEIRLAGTRRAALGASAAPASRRGGAPVDGDSFDIFRKEFKARVDADNRRAVESRQAEHDAKHG
jgi:hypothetical protein